MVRFVPSVWKAQGENVGKAADSFYRSAHGVIIAEPVKTRTASPLEAAAVAGDALCQNPWHHLIAQATEGMTSLGSKMVGTGDDYAATEEAAAAASERFWDVPS